MLCILLAISTLLTSWQFRQEPSAQMPNVDTVWREVTIPHDWAISGPFDRENDLQKVIVVQNGENEATWKTGRSGGLPWMGKAHYRTRVKVNKDKFYALVFDGAMSHADVYVNGEEMVYWPYGYNTFDCYILPHLITSDSVDIDVFLENKPQQSRWYPGAGLYRNVHLVESHPVHIPTFGILIRTPKVSKDFAQITFAAELQNGVDSFRIENTEYSVHTDILFDGKVVATIDGQEGATDIRSPQLWSPETPNIYVARTRVYKNKEIIDEVNTPFGIRSVSYTPEHGFQLNGETRKFKGVCLHHDLGPLGVAIHKDALRHQLTMLKEMGCDAVRTSHNMPAPELVELCDEMGIMLCVEPFDVWNHGKTDNDYHVEFDDWWKWDITNMVKHFRNNPSVMLWFGGYGLRAKEEAEAEKLLHDAKLLDEAGCFSIVLEKIPAALAEKVTKAVSCPVIGIGAGNGCDGQVLVLQDMLGLNQGFKPKFLRHFAKLAEEVKGAVGEYVSAVKDGSFPSAEESY